MTSKNDKLRGLFLAALMVLSITVGSIAFAGSAAAATNTSGSLSTPADEIEEIGQTYDFVADAEEDYSSDVMWVNVTMDDANLTNVDEGTSGATSADDVTVNLGGSGDLSDNTTVRGNVVATKLSSATSVSAGDSISVDVSSVINPTDAESKDFSVELAASDGTTQDSFTVSKTFTQDKDTTGASAPGAPSLTSAIEYDDSGTSTIEIAFAEAVFTDADQTAEDTGTALGSGDVEVWLNGEEVTGDYTFPSGGADGATNGQLLLTSTAVTPEPTDTLEVNITTDVEDDTGQETSFTNESITITGATALASAGNQGGQTTSESQDAEGTTNQDVFSGTALLNPGTASS